MMNLNSEDKNFDIRSYKENELTLSWYPLIKNYILIEKQC